MCGDLPMGKTSSISWTGATWNPWIGCRKVSPGCKNCYAEAWVENRMGRDFSKVRRSADATFFSPLKWKEPGYVFTCSLSDFFIEEADPWRPEAWKLIRETPHLTYQILTKRPENIVDRLPPDWGEGWKNVCLGTSIEMQLYTKRITILREVPAKVHFLSCEPLLGPLEFSDDSGYGFEFPNPGLEHIEWVIVGGESGPNHREMKVEWARRIRDQCLEAEIPFFFKQSSGPRSEMNPILEGREWREMPES